MSPLTPLQTNIQKKRLLFLSVIKKKQQSEVFISVTQAVSFILGVKKNKEKEKHFVKTFHNNISPKMSVYKLV